MPESGLTERAAGATEPSSRGGLLASVRIWVIHGLLFLGTVLTCTGFGSAVVDCFARSRPLTADAVTDGLRRLVFFEPKLWSGLWFSIPLLVILLAHEMGHYLECRRQGVDASLPYFLPSPLMFGTFGAFIKIRSPVYTREGLFDIGVRGPLAGFVALVPVLLAGVAYSKTGPPPNTNDAVIFGSPLILKLLNTLRFPGVPPDRIMVHPLLLAAWAGLFATALNLLPIGQLDGGHIVYALAGARWHRRIGLVVVAILLIAGRWYWPWWLWAAVLFVFGRRHPLIYDSARLTNERVLLAAVALLILFLSVTFVPFYGF